MPKGRPNGYKVEQIIEAIKGTGGIKSKICANLGGAHYMTVQRYITKYPTVREAYDIEAELFLDDAESVIRSSIALAQERIDEGKTADTSDARWLLSRKGRSRGYGDSQELDIQSGGKPLPFSEIIVEKTTNEDLAD